MVNEDPKQMCLDVSRAALALFDELDTKGDNAPMESPVALAKLVAAIHNAEALRTHYIARSSARIKALTGEFPQVKGKKGSRGQYK